MRKPKPRREQKWREKADISMSASYFFAQINGLSGGQSEVTNRPKEVELLRPKPGK